MVHALCPQPPSSPAAPRGSAGGATKSPSKSPSKSGNKSPSKSGNKSPGRKGEKEKEKTDAGAPLPRSAHAREYHHRDGARRLDGDGLVVEIYNLVWLQGNRLEGLTMPETVVLEQGFPKVWFAWSSATMELERRQGKEIVYSKLYDHWVSAAGCPIVAQFSASRTGSDGVPVLSAEYMDADGLYRFLQTRAHSVSGVLQRFVQPKVQYNVVLQCLWSPHATLCSGRRNIHLLTHQWVPPDERCCTFDGPANHSSQATVSHFVKAKVAKEMDAFAKHVQEQLRTRVTGLVGFFKFDERGQLFLLQCTSVRTLRAGDAAEVTHAPPLRLGVPFDHAKKTGADDIITVRFPDHSENGLTLPTIDLTTLTDDELKVLRVEDTDIIRLRPRRRRRRWQLEAEGGPSSGGEASAADEAAQMHRPRRVSLGLPDIARDYPEEFAMTTDFLNDVLYRARWHFRQQESDTAQVNFTMVCHADRVCAAPFEFVVPEDIIAIIGMDGLDEVASIVGAEECARETTPKHADLPAPKLIDPEDEDQQDSGFAGRSIWLRMLEPPPITVQHDTMADFVAMRLRRGLPKFQAGIDWEKVRLSRKARRSTRWYKVVGASEKALKARELAKKQAGLVTVGQKLAGKQGATWKKRDAPQQAAAEFDEVEASDRLKSRGKGATGKLGAQQIQPDHLTASAVLGKRPSDFFRERRASSRGVEAEDDAGSNPDEGAAGSKGGSYYPDGRHALYRSPGRPRFTKFLQKGHRSRSPPRLRRKRPGTLWHIAASFPPPTRRRRRGATPVHSPQRTAELASPPASSFWAQYQNERRPRSAAPPRTGRVPAPQMEYWLQ